VAKTPAKYSKKELACPKSRFREPIGDGGPRKISAASFAESTKRDIFAHATVLLAVGIADREMKRETGGNPVQFQLL